MWFIRLLNRLGLRKDNIACIRQVDTWHWPNHLGKRTEGKCANCDAPIYYEQQNEPFRKVCQHCCGL